MSIEVRRVTKRFGSFTALRDVSVHIPSGELVALLGPSGSGKTTLLRIIAGLEFPDAGEVWFDGRDLTHVHVRDRGVGFVFQHYALFRHMTVFANVAFGLRVRPRRTRPSRAETSERVMSLLRLVQLEHLADRRPAQLSGGQRQRVALARALAVEPRVLLLDEPFGALDAQVRTELRRWLRELHEQIHVTSVFVTHDQEEAMEIADRIVVMSQGQVEQVGSPLEVYHHPQNPFVYGFLGQVNRLAARMAGGRPVLEGAARAPARTDGAASRPEVDRKASVYVRPHMMEVDHRPRGDLHLPAVVRHVQAAGPTVRVELAGDDGGRIRVELPQERYRALRLKREDRVYVMPRDMRVFLEEEAS